MLLTEQVQMYWLIRQSWNDHAVAVRNQMSFGRVTIELRTLATYSTSMHLRRLSQQLLDDIVMNCAAPKSRQLTGKRADMIVVDDIQPSK